MLDSTSHPLRRSAEHAFVALAVFMGVTALSNGPFKATILEWKTQGTEQIAIEHAENASIGLDVSERHGAAILEFTNESSSALMLSLPEPWKRREVRGVRLEEVEQTSTGLGFIRWKLPANATVSFLAQQMPAHLIAHHPSKGLLKIALSRVNLETNSVTHDTILLQEDQEELW
jgi:hypothetical protein